MRWARRVHAVCVPCACPCAGHEHDRSQRIGVGFKPQRYRAARPRGARGCCRAAVAPERSACWRLPPARDAQTCAAPSCLAEPRPFVSRRVQALAARDKPERCRLAAGEQVGGRVRNNLPEQHSHRTHRKRTRRVALKRTFLRRCAGRNTYFHNTALCRPNPEDRARPIFIRAQPPSRALARGSWAGVSCP